MKKLFGLLLLLGTVSSLLYAGGISPGVSGNITVGSITSSGALVNVPVALVDGANISTNAALGNIFTVTIAGDRTLDAPTNAASGQVVTWVVKASGSDRTITLASGSGAFRFGTTITALSATTSAKTDYITAIYNAADSRWDVSGYAKGF